MPIQSTSEGKISLAKGIIFTKIGLANGYIFKLWAAPPYPKFSREPPPRGSISHDKIMNRLCPENLWNKFQRRSHYSNHNTRSCENLQVPKYNLEYSKKRFPYTALKAWNEIPMNIRELPTLYQYKKQLKSHLMS